MKSPPIACIAVIKTMCIMFDVPPKKVGQGKDKVEDYFTAAKESILNAKLLPRCQSYDKDNIDPKKIETLKPLIESPDYEEGKIENASKAAFGLSKWVKAMVQYDEAMKVVKPKQEELKGAKELAATAQAAWDTALEKLRAVEA
jgi:dynein heavy chain